jgi:undecaprenyl-diphosphatase
MTLDLTIFNFLNSLAGQSLFWDTIFIYIASHYSYVIVLLILFLIFTKYEIRKKARILLIAASAAIISRFAVRETIIFFYDRPRPFDVMEVNQLVFLEGYGAFPSGHASTFFAIAAAIYFHNKKWGAVFFGAILLMTIGRIIVGVHWPSDILGGLIAGATVAWLVVLFDKKFDKKLETRN